MKRECEDIRDELVLLAEGQENPRVGAHLETCEDCRCRLEQLRYMLSALKVQSFEAPPDLVLEAKSLIPNRSFRLSLIRTSLQTATARAPSQDFQAVYGGEGLEVRVMYSKVDAGWEVMGKAPSGDWQAENEASLIEVDQQGRFHFVIGSLDQTAFTIRGDGRVCDIPSVSEAIDGLRSDS